MFLYELKEVKKEERIEMIYIIMNENNVLKLQTYNKEELEDDNKHFFDFIGRTKNIIICSKRIKDTRLEEIGRLDKRRRNSFIK